MSLNFCTFRSNYWGSDFAQAGGSFVNVSDQVMISEENSKVEQARFLFLGSSLTNLHQF